MRGQLRGVGVGVNFAENVQLANAPGNELCVLRTEVQNENLLHKTADLTNLTDFVDTPAGGRLTMLTGSRCLIRLGRRGQISRLAIVFRLGRVKVGAKIPLLCPSSHAHPSFFLPCSSLKKIFLPNKDLTTKLVSPPPASVSTKSVSSVKSVVYLCTGESERPAPTELPQGRKAARVGG
jgi:hypothetical protein